MPVLGRAEGGDSGLGESTGHRLGLGSGTTATQSLGSACGPEMTPTRLGLWRRHGDIERLPVQLLHESADFHLLLSTLKQSWKSTTAEAQHILLARHSWGTLVIHQREELHNCFHSSFRDGA